MRLRDVIEAVSEPMADTVRTCLDLWQAYRRPSQARPPDAKTITYFQCGRGFGKSYVLSNLALDAMEDLGSSFRGLLQNRTADEAIEVNWRGSSGLAQASARRRYDCELQASRGPAGTVIHPTGAELRLGSGDIESGHSRGPQWTHYFADETASFSRPEAITNALFALRAPCPPGYGPWAVVASTPHYASKVHFDPSSTTIVRGTMEENASNLAPAVVDELRSRFSGSKLGRQELLGEVVSVEGALVDLDVIHRGRVAVYPLADRSGLRIAIGVDPSVSGGKIGRDGIGIVVVGVDADGHVWVLEDCTQPSQLRANEWSRVVLDAYVRHAAGSIVIEVNQGGDTNVLMLEQAAKVFNTTVNVVPVHARGSKRDRHERVLAPLYAQTRLHHCGEFEELERELCTYAYGHGRSPDRTDALSMCCEHLLGAKDEAPQLDSRWVTCFRDAWTGELPTPTRKPGRDPEVQRLMDEAMARVGK